MNEHSSILLDLYLLQVAYWEEVDQRGGEQATRFFIPDSEFTIGEKRLLGTDEISAFYRWRKKRGLRTARHLVSNCSVRSIGPTEAEFKSVLTLYADDGLPVLPTAPPVMISDVVDHCVLTDAGWKFKSRILKTIFQGGKQPTIPTNSNIIDNQAA